MKFATQILVLAFLLAAYFSQAAATNLVAKLAPTPPFPGIGTAAAAAAGIPVTGWDAPSDGTNLVPGDAVIYLVTLHERRRPLTQWLIAFQATTNPPPPVGKPADNPAAKPRPPMVLYTSTGNRYEFSRSPARIRMRLLGPFPNPIPAATRRPNLRTTPPKCP